MSVKHWLYGLYIALYYQNAYKVFQTNTQRWYMSGIWFKMYTTPNVGLEPTTPRLRVSCSTDWASRAGGQGAEVYVTSRSTRYFPTRFSIDPNKIRFYCIKPGKKVIGNNAVVLIMLYFRVILLKNKIFFNVVFRWSVISFTSTLNYLPRTNT